MKKLYKFTMTDQVEEKETVTSTDEDGNEVTTTKTNMVDKVRNFFIRKPTRKMYDEAELYYGVKLSEGIKAGMMTRALLAKRFENDGGVLSDDEKNRYSAMYFTQFELQNEYQRLSLTDKAKRTKEEHERIKEVVKTLVDLKQRIQDFESAQSSVFDQTAENRARNKTIMWWTLMLAMESVEMEDGDVVESHYFGDGNVEQKLEIYDSIEEQEETDEFAAEVMRKFAYFISFWYVGKASTEEDFANLATQTEEEKEDFEEQGEIIDEIVEEMSAEEKSEKEESKEEETAEEETAEEETAEEETAEEEAPEEEASEEEASEEGNETEESETEEIEKAEGEK